MAKAKKDAPIVVNDLSDRAIDDVLSVIDKLNPDACTLSEGSLANVTGYIDTGNYALNAIISGSVYGGVPFGRISGIIGPPQTGKTLVANKIMANAMRLGMRPVYFDSEQALDKQVAIRLGCDASKIKHVPIEIIEDCKVQIVNTLTKAIEVGAKKRLIIFIDSLGALSSKKELSDALENNTAGDMGNRAKQLKSMLLRLTYRAAKSETPIIFTNHIYDNPNERFPQLVKKQAGGYSPLYIASLLVQLSSTNIKVADETGVVGKLSEKVSGTNLRAFITKNRFIPPYLETEMYLNFKTGLDRYSGLLKLATSAGLIEPNGASYAMNGVRLGYASTFENDPEFWNNWDTGSNGSGESPLQKLDAMLKKELTYSNEAYSALKTEVEQIDKEVMDDSDVEKE